jgi:DNA-binding transcriptional LysR family regulator
VKNYLFGLGISVVATWAAGADIASGRLAAIPIKGGAFVRHWHAAATKETLELPHVNRFVQLLVENQRIFCGTKME